MTKQGGNGIEKRTIKRTGGIVVGAMALMVLGAASVHAGGFRGQVYDGDTIAPTARLTIDGRVSFDTPEISRRHGAQCDEEIALGRAARARLRRMIDAGRVVEMRPILTESGAMAVAKDGRALIQLMIDGENVGHRLAREGLALIYDWQRERVDWCSIPPETTARP